MGTGIDKRLKIMEQALRCPEHGAWLSCACDEGPLPDPDACLAPAEVVRFDDLLTLLGRAAGPAWQAAIERWGDCPICREPRACRTCEASVAKHAMAALPVRARRELRQFLLTMYPDAGTPEERAAFLSQECEEGS